MVKIAIKDLVEFIKRSAPVKPKNILPILSFIKLEWKNSNATLTKTALDSFIVHELKVKSKKEGVMLLDTKILSSAVANAVSDELMFEISDGGDIVIHDGKRITKFAEEDATAFPKIPEHETDDKITFSQDVLEAITLASYAIEEKVPQEWMKFVNTYSKGKKEGSYIVGTNPFAMYFKKFKEQLPVISLCDEAISVVRSYESAIYFSAGNYDFFDVGNSLYGFIKTTFKVADISMIVDNYNDKINFKMGRKEMLAYCTYVKSICPNTLGVNPFIAIEDFGKNKIMLRFSSAEYRISYDEDFEVEKNATLTRCWFNATHMIELIKALPFDQLLFSFAHGNIYLKTEDDKDFTGLVREIVIPSELVEQPKK